MPVTAKLSKQFYDRLGEAATNELVEWMNQVDAAYKFDLREINEMNFARFDAKVEQRFAESDARAERRFAELAVTLEQRFAATEIKKEQRVAASDSKFAESRGDNDRQFNELRSELRNVDSHLRLTIEKGLREQTRFFFVAWGVLLASIIALRFR